MRTGFPPRVFPIGEMAQMCALCALGFLPKEFFGFGGLFFGGVWVFVLGDGPECGEGTAAGNVSITDRRVCWGWFGGLSGSAVGSAAVGGGAGSAALGACWEREAAWASRSSVRCSKSARVGSLGEVMPVSRVSIMTHHTYGVLIPDVSFHREGAVPRRHGAAKGALQACIWTSRRGRSRRGCPLMGRSPGASGRSGPAARQRSTLEDFLQA
jgi:hypothetical protein